MSAHGNRKPPYHSLGRRQCEEKLRTECRKLRAIVSEAEKDYSREVYLSMVSAIETAVEEMQRHGQYVKWKGVDHE